ncbi:WD40-repeat-containing domain protein [Suillus subaureus]|uniref:WD40-repeat-containing domain protein n=1 Tax=Suillus subaureus TaxID=48587 RepID=A0A9P7JKQ7_9AGAM|nr:WD40-repeat-containing domain protein [Suillus subaureus]KAG1827592.1 WD40-repeat-containing domain protein [Suillus subaureus]
MGTGESLYAPLQGHTGYVNTVAISSDGNRIVSGSDDQTVRVWDMKTGEGVGAPFRGHTGRVLSVAISPDGKHIVSGSEDKTIRVWDDSSNPVSVTVNEDGWAVSPEGRLLLWISPILHPLTYVPGNTLVIPNHASQFDLRYLAHGTSWHMCRG